MKTLTPLLLLLLLLTACPEQPNDTMSPFVAFNEWRNAGRKVGSCENELAYIKLRKVPPSAIPSYCGSSAGVVGCFFYGPGVTPTVVVDDRHWTAPYLSHEFRHWLAMCSGEVPDGDPQHKVKWLFPNGGKV